MRENLIGKSIPRIDVKDKVTGHALYPGDFSKSNQTYMKVVFAEKAHAIIKKIDVEEAKKLPGVIMVLTAKDVPCNEYGLMKKDQPVLCGPGSGAINADRVRFVGDQVALIIAENEEVAENAAALISISYEDLPVVTNTEDALKTDSILLHPDLGSNELCQFHIRYGDIQKGYDQSDVIVESDYETPVQEHAYLQPESGLAYIDEQGCVTVIVAGQWVHEDREQIAHALNMPEEKIRVIYPAIGGAFGGREDMSVQIVLALAAYKLYEAGINRPVKTEWSRRESIIGHHKRHAYKIHTKWGASKEGKIKAIEAQIIADGGAYMYTSNKVLANATLMITGPYYVPNACIDSKAVATNNIPGGAFRGFGGPQACFAAEMQMNKLAQKLNMDPVKFRLINTIKEGQETVVRSPLPEGISIDHAIQECAQAAGWKKEKDEWTAPQKQIDPTDQNVLKGLGFAAGFKNVGFSFGAPEKCWAGIKIIGEATIEKIILKHAGADVGQGAHSVFVQLAADLFNVSINQVELIASDTAKTGNSGSASASRMTFMAGNAILGAAKIAKEKWENEERPVEIEYTYRPPATTPFDPIDGSCKPNFCYGYVADAVEVSVNKRTGKVLIDKIYCADDVGRAINPQQVKGQIEGALVQASGYAVLENFVQENGMVKTDSLSTYLIPTIMDIPEKIDTIILEDINPIGPLGAVGVGEMSFLPFAPAVLSAIHDATGHWFNKFPLNEERVLEGLGAAKKS